MRLQNLSSAALITVLLTLAASTQSNAAPSAHAPVKQLSQSERPMAIAQSQQAPGAASKQAAEDMILDVDGVLEDGDQVLPQDGSFYDEYTFEGSEGQEIVINLESADFDTFLVLLDPEAQVIGQNDDISEENYNSSLTVTLPSDGTYTIIANGFDSNSLGSYKLTVMSPEQSASLSGF